MPSGFRTDAVLNQNVDKLWDSCLSNNTKAAYQTGLHCFLTFLTMSGVIMKSGILPKLTEDVLIYFVTHCHTSLKLKWTTIKLYLAGIRYHYIKSGGSNPLIAMDRLQYIIRGIKRTQNQSVRRRLPITIQLLHQICGVLKTGLFSLYIDQTVKCMCITAFYGFLRCSEFTVSAMQPNFLCIKDVVFSKDKSAFTLFLASSKTDPFRNGVTLYFFQTKSLCPVECMYDYIVNFRKQHMNSDAPLFVDDKNQPFNRDVFISCLRRILSLLGYSASDYCGHSFRIGASTTAAAAGIEDHMIKMLGRWNSSSYLRYIHVDRSLIRQAQNKISD